MRTNRCTGHVDQEQLPITVAASLTGTYLPHEVLHAYHNTTQTLYSTDIAMIILSSTPIPSFCGRVQRPRASKAAAQNAFAWPPGSFCVRQGRSLGAGRADLRAHGSQLDGKNAALATIEDLQTDYCEFRFMGTVPLHQNLGAHTPPLMRSSALARFCGAPLRRPARPASPPPPPIYPLQATTSSAPPARRSSRRCARSRATSAARPTRARPSSPMWYTRTATGHSRAPSGCRGRCGARTS